VGLAGLVAGLANMGFHFVIARDAGSATYGAVAALIPIGTTAAFLATGTEYTVARITILHRGPAERLLPRALAAVFPWVLVSALLLALSGPLAAYLHLGSFVPVALSDFLFCAVMIGAAATGILVGRGLFPVIIVLQLVAAFLRLGGGALLGRGQGAVTGAIAASVIPAVVVSCVGLLVAIRARPREGAVAVPAADRLKSVTGEGVSRALLAACLLGAWSLPLAFARHYLGAAQAGNFAAAQLLASGLVFAGATLVQLVYPSVARRPGRDRVVAGVGATLALCMGSAAALAFAGPALVGALFGGAFSDGTAVLAALSASAATTVLAILALWMVRALGRYVFVAYVGIGAAVPTELLVGTLWHTGAVAIALGPALAVCMGFLGTLAVSTVMARRIPRPLNAVIDVIGRQQPVDLDTAPSRRVLQAAGIDEP